MKYIMLKLRGQLIPVIFPNQLVHADIADALKKLPELESAKIHSAGFCNISVSCSGKSTTLDVESDARLDAAVINTHDYIHGFTGEIE